MWDAIVIGSGIGGMTAAGLLAGVASKKVLVLEKHSEPGGLTHVFRRDGASWDVGLHYVGEVLSSTICPAASCAGTG
jgi:phytoene dehydrogenase-like protein